MIPRAAAFAVAAGRHRPVVAGLALLFTACMSAPAADTALTASLRFGDADNGSTVHLRKGQAFDVVLASTYWQFTGSSNPQVVAAQGPARIVSRRAECVPGAGCGSVTQTFIAAAPGQSQVRASRSVCGEALACRPEQQSYTLTVDVADDQD